MITINTQQELEALIIDYKIIIDDDLTIKCDIHLPGVAIDARNIKAFNIKASNINASNINARNIDAWDVNTSNITARNIDAWNVNASNITARNINAGDIDVLNIKANDIGTNNIKAGDISYSSSAIARESFVCKSIKGRGQNAKHLCLIKEIEFIN
jgi:hypothetical protein